MPATRKEMTTAGPAVSFATAPAREKMPAPMMPPTPIAVSCQSPSVRSRPFSGLGLDLVDGFAPQERRAAGGL
jgi:hypothetical protein